MDELDQIDKLITELQEFCVKTLAEVGTMRIQAAILRNALTKSN